MKLRYYPTPVWILNLIVLFSISLALFLSFWFSLQHTGIETKGTIISIQEKKVYDQKDHKEYPFYFPTIKFMTKDGQDIVTTEKNGLGASEFSSKPGDEIKMYYDPANPQNFAVYSAMSYYLSLVTSVFFLILFISLLVVFMNRKKLQVNPIIPGVPVPPSSNQTST